MADPRISEDSVLRIGRAVNEAEDMRVAASDALKDIWADARAEFKALGLTGAEVSAEVGEIKVAIVKTRMSQADLEKAENKAEGVDFYVSVLSSPRARTREAAE